MNCDKHDAIQMGHYKIPRYRFDQHVKRNPGCNIPGVCSGLLFGMHCIGCGDRV